MSENQKRILEMLAEKKITVEEAERLLALTTSEAGDSKAGGEGNTERKAPFKYLRVEVRPGPDADGTPQAEKVNVRVPMNLIRAGMKLTSLIPPQAYDKVHDALAEKGINFDLRSLKPDDMEELIAALGELEVDVESGRETVKVYVE